MDRKLTRFILRTLLIKLFLFEKRFIQYLGVTVPLFVKIIPLRPCRFPSASGNFYQNFTLNLSSITTLKWKAYIWIEIAKRNGTVYLIYQLNKVCFDQTFNRLIFTCTNKNRKSYRLMLCDAQLLWKLQNYCIIISKSSVIKNHSSSLLFYDFIAFRISINLI